ncbi:tRNA wybutosine-synthesizing protein 4-like [Macrosteles quadrilineatus]|uniref:tRNA wybutosine-synthesizing protein 4-like n=1 Tax=Macrosteles quadrilineatus TaxID=74068 RepID=UPI0023E2883B|nr:tRNA wybutosine-synthesizing protein 4-like [Macrosteles quadrilineatus]
MSLQVEGTNDSSCLSKFSATQRGYFSDEFLQHFVSKCPRRAPLIHLGYSVRAAIINTLIEEYMESESSPKQIISLGAGFDTLYFKLKKKYPNRDVRYYEFDLPRVVERKIKCIKGSDKLSSIIKEFTVNIDGLSSKDYKLLAVDLRVVEALSDMLQKYSFDPEVPTLFLSECAITYLEEEKSTDLIRFASSLKNATFITYEQLHPDDGFGRVMLRHFTSLQSPLMSVEQYPTLELQTERYTRNNWDHCTCLTALEAYKSLIPEQERSRVLSLEPFDEWEEFYLKCMHYTVVIASKGSLSNWSKICSKISLNRVKHQMNNLTWTLVKAKRACRYGHNLVKLNGHYVLIGGFGLRKDGTHGRMKDIVWLKQEESQMIVSRDVEVAEFATMYSTWTLLSNGSFIVYGGRTSPANCVFSCPQLVTFQPDGSVKSTLLLNSCNRLARWRHSAVVVEREAVETFLVFGGRTSDLQLLNDTWMVLLHPNVEDRKIIDVDEFSSKKPCPRFSHTACVRHCEMWVYGGMSVRGPLSDAWCLDINAMQWRQLEVTGGNIARFGHSASVHDHSLVLVGGVSYWDSGQPPVSVLDLHTGAILHYQLPAMEPERSLLVINHCHIVSEEDKAIVIVGGGGNCFSFGTFFNSDCAVIKLKDINL